MNIYIRFNPTPSTNQVIKRSANSFIKQIYLYNLYKIWKKL